MAREYPYSDGWYRNVSVDIRGQPAKLDVGYCMFWPGQVRFLSQGERRAAGEVMEMSLANGRLLGPFVTALSAAGRSILVDEPVAKPVGPEPEPEVVAEPVMAEPETVVAVVEPEAEVEVEPEAPVEVEPEAEPNEVEAVEVEAIEPAPAMASGSSGDPFADDDEPLVAPVPAAAKGKGKKGGK